MAQATPSSRLTFRTPTRELKAMLDLGKPMPTSNRRLEFFGKTLIYLNNQSAPSADQMMVMGRTLLGRQLKACRPIAKVITPHQSQQFQSVHISVDRR
jgi:hypothetical protein